MQSTLLLVFLITNLITKAQWTELNGTTKVSQPYNSIGSGAADSQGNVFAVLASSVQIGGFYLGKWDGVSWTEVGNSKSHARYSHFTFVLPDNQGAVYSVCFIDANTSAPRVGIVKWDGSICTEVISFNYQTYGIPDGYGPLSQIPICFNKSGEMFFVTTKFNSMITKDTIIQTLYRWNNTNLSIVYQSARPYSFGNVEIRDIQCDSQASIYASGDFKNSEGYTVVKWNGTTWNEVVGTNSLKTFDRIIGLCIDNRDHIFAYAEGCDDRENKNIHFSEWNGSQWVNLTSPPSLDINWCRGVDGMSTDANSNFYISARSYDQQTYNIYTYKGSLWHQINFPICNTSNSSSPCGAAYALCFDKDQNLIAQGSFTNASGEFYIAKYNNTQLVSLHEQSDLLQGISVYPNPTNSHLYFRKTKYF